MLRSKRFFVDDQRLRHPLFRAPQIFDPPAIFYHEREVGEVLRVLGMILADRHLVDCQRSSQILFRGFKIFRPTEIFKRQSQIGEADADVVMLATHMHSGRLAALA